MSRRTLEQLADLHRQGFMKPRRVRAPKPERPIIACAACLNWHREGKHTASVAERRENLRRAKESTPRCPGCGVLLNGSAHAGVADAGGPGVTDWCPYDPRRPDAPRPPEATINAHMGSVGRAKGLRR